MSTGQDCRIYQIPDGRWFCDLERYGAKHAGEEEDDGSDPVYDTYGPFVSDDDAITKVSQRFGNPGGFTVGPVSQADFDRYHYAYKIEEAKRL